MKNSNKIKAGIFVLPLIIFILSFTAGGCSDNNTTNTSTTRIYKQVDQVGRPAINTVFVGASDSLQKNTFNITVPSQMQAAFLSTFTSRLMGLNPGYTT